MATSPTPAAASVALLASRTAKVNMTRTDAGVDTYYSLSVSYPLTVPTGQLLDGYGRVPSAPPAEVTTWVTDVLALL